MSEKIIDEKFLETKNFPIYGTRYHTVEGKVSVNITWQVVKKKAKGTCREITMDQPCVKHAPEHTDSNCS